MRSHQGWSWAGQHERDASGFGHGRLEGRWIARHFVGAGFSRLLRLARSPVGERERGGFGVGAALAGAGLGVDGSQVVLDEAGVNLRGDERAVAEHFLNVADARAAAQHADGARVPQAVRGGVARESGLLRMAAHDDEEALRRELCALFGEEQARAADAWLCSGGELRSCVLQVKREPFERDMADGHEAVFAALGLLDGG